MSWIQRLANTLRPDRHDREIERELHFHLEERIDQLRSDGLSEDEARRQARRQFGNPLVQRERTRDAGVAQCVDSLLRNVRHAVCALRRTPGFSVTAILILAAGIGANTAVFSAMDAVLSKPVRFPDSDRLMRVRQVQQTEASIGPARLEDWNRLSSAFEMLSGYYVEDVTDTTPGLPERHLRAVVAPRFLEVLGVAPALGRKFIDAEYRVGASPAVLISDRYWRMQFGAAPDVLNRTIRLADRPHAIVGVMPPDFAFPHRDVDLWWPYPIDDPLLRDSAANRQLQWYTGIGRLKRGVSPEQARADLDAVQGRLAQVYPNTDRGIRARLVPLADTLGGGGVRASLWLLFGAVSVLLLIACTNVVALLLSRTARREHEIAIRLSLGASRTTIAAQLFTETSVLTIAGATAGVFVALAASRGFAALAPGMPGLDSIRIEPRMLIFTLATATLVALLCGVLPALRTARGISLSRDHHAGVFGGHSMQWLLVAVQVALSVALLSGAGLLARSVQALSRVEPGFDAERILAFRVSGSWSEHYDNPAALLNRIDTTLEQLTALPGIEAAATSWTLPGAPGPYEIEFEPAEGRAANEPPILAGWRTVSPGYFATMRISLRAGELCRSMRAGIHRPGSTLDLMVNRRFADRYFALRSPIGSHFSWDTGTLSGRIVGVVSDARELGIDRDVVPTVYACDSAPNPFPWFVVRTSDEPAAMAGVIRMRLGELEPLRSVYDVAPLDKSIGGAYAQHRLRTWLLTIFSVVALGLVCAGIYGTLSYAVGLRRREVALRLALGALRRTVIRQLMATSVRIVGTASVVGVGLALFLGQSLSTMLYGVSPADPLTLCAVIVLVLTVALLAAFVPAARAAFVQPAKELRH